MKHIPKRIYLQVGNECPEDVDFEELEEVSWNKDKVFENDIRYVNEESVYKAFMDIASYLEDSIYRGINPIRIEERFTELLKQ